MNRKPKLHEANLRWLISALVSIFLLASSAAHAQVGALVTDCRFVGKQADGSYQFVATCNGRSVSPDGRFAVVQRAYRDKQSPIEFQNARGRTLARLKSLSDDMPFAVSWAPNSDWFYVNHHVGSFMDILQVFEVAGRSVIERRELVNAAAKLATRRYPCLSRRAVLPNGARWLGDHEIVLVTISSTRACSADYTRHPGKWRPLWMIGDVRTGHIDPASIRVQPDDKPFLVPRDGRYATLNENPTIP